MQQQQRFGELACVVGGSFAGMFAAAVLARHFTRVVILERDSLADSAARKGVPQSEHPHVLLAAGSTAIETLLAGVFDRVTAAGGLLLDTSFGNTRPAVSHSPMAPCGHLISWWTLRAGGPTFRVGYRPAVTQRRQKSASAWIWTLYRLCMNRASRVTGPACWGRVLLV
jgi:hypothetical protein